MPTIRVQFRYCPGLLANPFRNVRLCGSWDASGRAAAQWAYAPMQPTLDDDGRSAFNAQIDFDEGGSARFSAGGCSSMGHSDGISGELQRRWTTRPPRRASDPSRWRLRTRRQDHRQRPTISLNAAGWVFALSQTHREFGSPCGHRMHARSTSSSPSRRMATLPTMGWGQPSRAR